MSRLISTRSFFTTFSATETQLVNNGEPIIIDSITVDGSANVGTHTLTDATSDSNTILIFRVRQNNNVSCNIPFIAYNGLKIGTSTIANHITVFWRPTG